MQESHKETWLDLAKAIGIILVVIGHSTTSRIVSTIIYAFHMPLFFFISGYLYNLEKYRRNWSGLLSTRWQSLMIPYATGVILAYAYDSLGLASGDHFSAKDTAIGFMVANGMNFNQFSLPMWFLPAMFVTTIAFGLVYPFLSRLPRWLQALLFVLLAVAGRQGLMYYRKLPWALDLLPITLLFFFSGYLVKELGSKVWSYRRVLFGTAVLLFVTGFAFNGPADMFARGFGRNFGAYYLTGMSGILAVACLCMEVSKWSAKLVEWLTFLGDKSLPILILHPISFNFVYWLLWSTFGALSINFAHWEKIWPLFSLGGVLVPALLIYVVIDRYQLTKLLFTGRSGTAA